MDKKKVMRFIGVSTGASSINKTFPKWAEILNLNAELRGLDLPIGASAEQYRSALDEMLSDPNCVGALVTTHKIALYEGAKDRFESFDSFASACGEISSLKISEGKLHGSAKDPIAAGLSIEEFLEPNHFKNGASVLCFGDGGAASAIAWYLTGLEVAPKDLYFSGISETSLNRLQGVIADRPNSERVKTFLADPNEINQILENLAPASLIINATGMGKDIPGSPMPLSSKFPSQAIIWELNYRGSREFLQQAKNQGGDLKIHDGWRYFIHGWSQVVAEVFDIELTPKLLIELRTAAEITK
jgi:shikimate 5-dehydrogenase